jgi:hypothetical protein
MRTKVLGRRGTEMGTSYRSQFTVCRTRPANIIRIQIFGSLLADKERMIDSIYVLYSIVCNTYRMVVLRRFGETHSDSVGST